MNFAGKKACSSVSTEGLGGLYSNCMRFLPPLIVTDEQIDEAMGVLGEAVAATLGAQ